MDKLKEYIRKNRWTLIGSGIFLGLYELFRFSNIDSPYSKGLGYEIVFLAALVIIPVGMTLLEVVTGTKEITQEPEWAWSNAIGGIILVVIIFLFYLVFKHSPNLGY